MLSPIYKKNLTKALGLNLEKSQSENDVYTHFANKKVSKIFQQNIAASNNENANSLQHRSPNKLTNLASHDDNNKIKDCDKMKRNSKSEENLFNLMMKHNDNASFSFMKPRVQNQLKDVGEKRVEINKRNCVKEETEKALAKALQDRLADKEEIQLKEELDREAASAHTRLDLHLSAEELGADLIDNQEEQGEDNADMMPPLYSPQGVRTDSQGLIVPKKIGNPCLESSDRQNLHRELLFNQKMGKNVLNQKSELQKALEKQKERQLMAQQNMQMKQKQEQSLGGELGRVIMQRAQRLENQKSSNQSNDLNNQHVNPEYLNARAKLRATIDTK